MAFSFVAAILIRRGFYALTVSLLAEDIYFFQNNEYSRTRALELRDAILSLRKDGAFAAVPLFRVNFGPIGPHPVGMCVAQ